MRGSRHFSRVHRTLGPHLQWRLGSRITCGPLPKSWPWQTDPLPGIWSADLDANGRQDLLIGMHFPGLGRCVDGAELVVLLFESNGRPVPWQLSTQVPAGGKFPYVPAIVLDADGNGRAEIVTTSCEYADGSRRFGEDRRVTGVYQALEARWMPLQQAVLASYVSAAKTSHRVGGQGWVRWLPARPRQWEDPMRGLDSAARVRITRLTTGEIGCGGAQLKVDNNKAEHYRVSIDTDDPCARRATDHVEYSDGRTFAEWPLAVIDAPEGRDIYVARSDEAQRRILRGGYLCKLLGPEAAPTWVWADAVPAEQAPGRVSARLVTTQVSRKTIILREGPAPASDIDAYAERGRACFSLRLNADVPEMFVSQGCPYPEKYRKAGIHAGQLRIRESMAWQVLSGERELRLWRSEDAGRIATLRFEAPGGEDLSLVGVTELGSYWLAEWNGSQGHLLALHDDDGRPIDNIERATVEGELFSSNSYDGLYLLRWSNGRPRELIQLRAAVEWSVAR